MKPAPVTSQDEARLLTALDRLKQALDEEAILDPNEAAAKVARDMGLTDDEVRLVCNAYNTGRQLDQYQSGQRILEKLSPFELLDPDRVKTASWAKDAHVEPWVTPVRLDEPLPQPQTKAAAAKDWTWTRPELPVAQVVNQAEVKLATAQRAADFARTEVSAAYAKISQALEKFLAYFRQPKFQRLSVKDAALVTVTRCGPETAPLFRTAAALYPEEATDASLKVGRPVRPDEPIFKLAMECVAAAKNLADALERYATKRQEYYQAYRQARPKTRAESPARKEALMEDVAWESVQRALGHPVRTRSDKVRDFLRDLENVGHHQDLKELRVKTILTELMTDPDDVISSYPPERVIQAYNDIITTAPRVADQPGLLRSLLRRYLTGNMEVFEAKEIAETEKALAQTISPRYVDIRTRMLDDDDLLE